VEDETRPDPDRSSAGPDGAVSSPGRAVSSPGASPAVPSSSASGSARRTIYLGAAAAPPSASSRCPICLERVAPELATCPECGESLAAGPPSAGPLSIPDDQPGDSWLKLHWRPIVTMGAMVALVCSGVALRSLAPGRFLTPPHASSKSAAAASPPACATPCWTGEACQAGKCVWQPPNDVGHVASQHEPTVGGPYGLPKDVSDALPLDGERFAVALLAGISVRNTRTGGELSLVTDAPQSRGLYHVGPVLYATAPQRIYVVDNATTRLLKTIETGAPAFEITVGASGRRALASLPTAHAIAVIATEFHAEIERIQFGDDQVGPMGADDTGKRALTTTGQIPLAGLRDPPGQGGAVYAFDPSRLASAQDRVRASMVGNPVSVLTTPDGEASYVVLRAEDALVPLEWQPSGAVRQEARIPTCREPEQIALVRRGRLGLVRCNEGHSVEVFDLTKRELVRHVSFNARVADMAVAPDGKQAIVALPADGAGFVGIMDLETYAVKVLPLTAEPTRVRLSPDGSVALVLSDRAKVAWVIR
jgi:DNA-binding beta-propeller fold protein YncE